MKDTDLMALANTNFVVARLLLDIVGYQDFQSQLQEDIIELLREIAYECLVSLQVRE